MWQLTMTSAVDMFVKQSILRYRTGHGDKRRPASGPLCICICAHSKWYPILIIELILISRQSAAADVNNTLAVPAITFHQAHSYLLSHTALQPLEQYQIILFVDRGTSV